MCEYLENVGKLHEENKNHPWGVPEWLSWLSVRLLILARSQGPEFKPRIGAYIPAWSLLKQTPKIPLLSVCLGLEKLEDSTLQHENFDSLAVIFQSL